MDETLASTLAAGRAAMERSDHGGAVAHFERALELARRLPVTRQRLEQEIDIRLDLRLALLPLEEIDRILAHLDEAARLAERLGDPARQARIAASIANARNALGDHEGATEAGRRTLAIAEELGDERLKIVARNQLGAVYWCRGEHRAAIEVYSWNAEHIRGALAHDRLGLAGYPAVIARAGLALCLAEVGAFDEALDHGRAGVALAERLEHPPTLSHAYLFLGGALLRRGELGEAIQALEGSLALCRAHDLRLLVPGTATWLGYAYALAGRLEEGMPLLEEGEAHAAATGRAGARSHRDACLAEGYLLAGRWAEAAALADQALDLSTRHGEQGFRAEALRVLGEIAGRRPAPNAAEAEAWFRDALEAARRLGMRPLEARCRLGLGRLSRVAGRPAAARQHLEVAAEQLGAMGMALWEQEATAELGTLE